jgi:Protein of unknown function (DUF1176)
MIKHFVGFLMIMSGVPACAVPEVAPSKVVSFKDWAVGCDNGLACQAVSFVPEGYSDESISLTLMRGAEIDAAPQIEISGFTNKTDRYSVLVDGKVAYTANIVAPNEVIQINGTDAITLSRVFSRGRMLRLVDGAGLNMGRIPLSGVSATLRYIDAAQGRSGSRGAMLAKGRKPAAVKKAELPVIMTKRIIPTNVLPDTESLVTLSENSPCSQERFGQTQDAAYSLGSNQGVAQALILLNCGAGAYNTISGAYIGTRDAKGIWSYTPARFDYAAKKIGADSNVAVLINSKWDGASQSLSSYSKARGIGDCGSSEHYVWDGERFRLTQASIMDECRGARAWIPVWRAEVKLTG